MSKQWKKSYYHRDIPEASRIAVPAAPRTDAAGAGVKPTVSIGDTTSVAGDVEPPAASGAGSDTPRGRMLRAADVAEEVFSGAVSEWWVRRNVAPTKRIRLGHSTVVWYEGDVRAWLQQRGAAL